MFVETKSGTYPIGTPEFVMGYCLWSILLIRDDLDEGRLADDNSVPKVMRSYQADYLKARDSWLREGLTQST